MAQTPKFIDITRTFIPIDPNAFPQGLTVGGGESSPEERIPAMAYKGYNFMPTSYGYRSYFGLNATLNIAAAPANVNELFIFQNALLENVLIALAATGIWIKKGEATGAWTHPVTYTAPVGETSLLWTYVIIADKLYVYQQGAPSYYEIISHATTGVTITARTPNFLLMQFQVGIFRANGRLAFWDVADAISWSNLDDFSDFEPSLETLAGNATFSDVQGRIINIISHGEGFMIYASKSIMYVSQDVANLYQWKPKVILPSTGIQYPRQACAASPDTLHFAYTTEGLKKIEKAQQETIVPEVTDFFKGSEFPIYLKILEGRFLFFEMMDAIYIIGTVQNGEELIPAETYEFDGSSYTLNSVVIPPEPAGICSILDGIDNGDYTDAQPRPGAGPGSGSPTNKPADAHPTNPEYKPDWICFIAGGGMPDAENIKWKATPCPTVDLHGKDALMCPDIRTTADYTTDATNKREVSGADAYQDGKWTMERFQAVQAAIWEREDRAVAATLAAIEAKAAQDQKNEQVSTCTPTTLPLARNTCLLGQYPSEFSAPSFGFNLCSFWMTRYVTGAREINRIMTNSVACNLNTNNDLPGNIAKLTAGSVTLGVGAILQPMDGPAAAIAAAAVAARNAASAILYEAFPDGYLVADYVGYAISGGSSTPANTMQVSITSYGSAHNSKTGATYYTNPYAGLAGVQADIVCPVGYKPYMNGSQPMCRPTATYEKVSIMSAFNEGRDVPIAPIPESGYCVIKGWGYKKADNSTGYVSAGTCTSTNGTIKPPSKDASPSGTSSFKKAPLGGPAIPIDPVTGDVCGVGADGFTLDGEEVTWPGTSVTIPASSFLFYKGQYAPFYPTIEGAFVYDLQLKKWGKMKAQYKLLFDYSPINSSATGIVDPTVFGILGGLLKLDGKLSIFDRAPSESYITYGKVGYYRLGNTSVEEVRVDFRTPSTGFLKVDTSLEGSALNSDLSVVKGFANAFRGELFGAWPGRWVNITISGIYDISYLEYRGFTQGRR